MNESAGTLCLCEASRRIRQNSVRSRRGGATRRTSSSHAQRRRLYRHLAQDRGGPKDRPGRLFIGVIVGAMQEEHEKVAKADLEAERDIIE
ncbi:MAG: hypothetical protein ACJ8ES_10515, partial [Xanthobacteraceae bacterium]